MNTNLQGNIAETVALKYFIEKGYEVYLPFGTASKVDMIVCKNNIIERVSVKSTSSITQSGKYALDIRQHLRKKVLHFDCNNSDIVFAYVVPEDRFLILKSLNIKNKNSIVI